MSATRIPNSLISGQPLVDVETFGAVADGTTDNSPLIQAAIDSLPAYGGILVIRSGASFYSITSGLDFTGHDNVSVISNGATIKVAAGYVDTRYNTFPNYGLDSIFRFYDCSGVRIQGPLTLDANIQNRTANVVSESFNSCILLIAVAGATIHDVTCNNSMTDGITLVRNATSGGTVCSDITITECHCDSARRNGISLVDQNHVLIDNCSFTNAGASQGTAPMAGIDIEPDDATTGHSRDITIRKCYLDGNLGDYAISVGGKGTNDLTIDNCIIHVSGTRGVNFNATVAYVSTNTLFINNIIELSETVVPSVPQVGLRSVGKNLVRAAGNRISGFITGASCADADGIIYEGNYFTGNGYGISLGDISNPMIRAYVYRNTFEDNTNPLLGVGGPWYALAAYPATTESVIEFDFNTVRNTTGNTDKQDGAITLGASAFCNALARFNTSFNLDNLHALTDGHFKISGDLGYSETVDYYKGFWSSIVNFETGRLYINDRLHYWTATGKPVAQPSWGIWNKGDWLYNTIPTAGNIVAYVCRTDNTVSFDGVYSIIGTPGPGMIPAYQDGGATWVGDKRTTLTTSSVVAADFADGSYHTLLMDTSGGDLAVTMPHADVWDTREIEIVNVGSGNTCFVNRTAPTTFFNYTSVNAFTLTPGEKITFVADAANDRWVVKAGSFGSPLTAIQSTYTNFTTSATYQRLRSLVIPSGDWNIFWTVTFYGNGATITAGADAIVALSSTDASAAGAVEGDTLMYIDQSMANTNKRSISGHTNLVLSAQTTYYLNAQATFTVGNPQFVARLWARRVR